MSRFQESHQNEERCCNQAELPSLLAFKAAAKVNPYFKHGKKNMVSVVSPKIDHDSCDGCVKIPITLGNGLPAGFVGPVAPVANSDGSFGPFIITTPGNYVLQNSTQMQISNSVYIPNQWQTANPSIIIQSSDVDLDLCGQTITGSGNLTKQYFIDNGVPLPNIPGGIQNDVRIDATIGILVNPEMEDLFNISIHNGKLEYHMTALLHFNVTDFRLYDMRIENNGSVTALQNLPPFEFFPNSTQGFFATNVTYDKIQCFGNRSSELPLNTCTNIVYTNIQCSGLRGNGQAFGTNGVFLTDPEFIEFGEFAASILFFNCRAAVFDNVVIRDVKALLTAMGIFMDAGTDSRIRNCLVDDVEQHAVNITRFVDNFNLRLSEARGYAVNFATGTTLIENCGAENIHSRLQFAYDRVVNGIRPDDAKGYSICCGSEYVIVRNCYASNITSAGNVTFTVGPTVFPNRAGAFDGENTDRMIMTLENCRAVSVNGGLNQPNPAMKNKGLGFSLPLTGRSFDLLSCTAVDCIGNSESAGFEVRSNASLTNCQSSMSPLIRIAGELGHGFLITGSNALPTGAANLLRECTARNHSLHGFRVTSDSSRNKLIESVALGNALSGFSISGRQVSLERNISDFNAQYGFFVDGTSATLLANSATQNTVGGFRDASALGGRASGNFYARNKATDNGTCGTWKCNYEIDYVTPHHCTILQVGSLNPPRFPKCCYPEANVSLSLNRTQC